MPGTPPPEGFPDDIERIKQNRRLFNAVEKGDADGSVEALANIFKSRGLRARAATIAQIPIKSD